MIDMSWDEFWWNRITGAHAVVSKVTDALLDCKMVILAVPSDLPWRHSMRISIHNAFESRADTRDIVIEDVDIVDDNQDDLDPGRFLLQRFASPLVSKGYREKSKSSIQDYIVQNNVLKNRIIWVKGLEGSTANKWIKFCKGFTPKTISNGLFVLEVHGNISASESRFMKYINFSDNVSNFDVQLFNSFILDESRDKTSYSDLWKKYISTSVAIVCNFDAQVSELLLREVDFRKESPIDGIARLSQLPEFSRRGSDEDSQHVFWLYRNNKIAELNRRVWASQVQVLFPVIEMERVELIQKYIGEIHQALVYNSIVQYGVTITEPIDAELGTLCYMMSHRRDDNSYMLYIPVEADRERIKFLHTCRNLIAHAMTCTPEQVTQLLDRP